MSIHSDMDVIDITASVLRGQRNKFNASSGTPRPLIGEDIERIFLVAQPSFLPGYTSEIFMTRNDGKESESITVLGKPKDIQAQLEKAGKHTLVPLPIKRNDFSDEEIIYIHPDAIDVGCVFFTPDEPAYKCFREASAFTLPRSRFGISSHMLITLDKKELIDLLLRHDYIRVDTKDCDDPNIVGVGLIRKQDLLHYALDDDKLYVGFRHLARQEDRHYDWRLDVGTCKPTQETLTLLDELGLEEISLDAYELVFERHRKAAAHFAPLLEKIKNASSPSNE